MAKGNEVIMYLVADNKDLKAKLSDAEKTISELQKKTEKGAGGIATAMKRIGGVIAGYFGIQAIKQFVNFAGEVDSVSRSFYNLAQSAQGGGEALLRSMREASAGTMSNLDMMKSANLAMQLMGDQVIQHLPQMARVARAAALASGRDVSFMMESLVVATGRQSILVLDNLGISSATASRYISEYAQSIGTTADKMTAAQKSQAFFYASMKAGQELIDRIGTNTLTFGEQLQVLNATAENAAAAFAEGLIPGLFNAITAFDDTAASGEGVVNMLRDMGKWISRAITGWAELANFVRLFRSIGNQRDSLERTAQATQRLTEYQEQLNRKYGDWHRASQDEINTRNQLMEIANNASGATQNHLDATVTLSNRISQAYDRVENAQRRATAGTRRHTQAIQEQAAEQKRTQDSIADYYSFIGDERMAELRRLDLQKNRLAETYKNDAARIEALGDAHYLRMEAIELKYDAFRKSLSEGWVSGFKNAYNSFEDATKSALKETLTGENGWDAWQKSMKAILQQLVVDLMYAIAKALLLKAITAEIGGPTGIGGGFVGGVIKGAFFEKGYIPEFSKGRIPVLQSGLMPADHFPAYIGTREAVINAESTRANLPLLAAMNANPGAAVGGGDVNVNVVAEVDGEVLFRVNEKRRQERATALGMQNYGRRSVYR